MPLNKETETFAESAASLQRGTSPRSYECLGYDTKQFDGEVTVMLELWGI